MRLYKYYSFDSGLAAIKSRKYGFRRPTNFNDPFELSFFSNSKEYGSEKSQLHSTIDQIRQSVVILSLTRTPKNPLMWAHYGQDHKGFVIGYDVNDRFLKSYKYNVIPVDDGEVVYTNTKSRHVFNSTSMQKLRDTYLSISGDSDVRIDNEGKSLSRKIFLTKHASWVYEEEVRVVKVIDSLFEESHVFQSNPLRSFSSPTEINAEGKTVEKVPGLVIFNHEAVIKSIYLGVRNPLLTNPRIHMEEISALTEMGSANNWKFRKLLMSKSSWSLNTAEISPESLGA